MSYLDFLWSLCHKAFKRLADKTQSDIYRLMGALAAVFEKVRTDIYFTRKQYFIKTCSDDSLMRHGRDIHFQKFDSESMDQYRVRMLAAYDYFRAGGTIPGMIQAFTDMGYPSVQVVEHFRTAGLSEWAIFSILTSLEDWQNNTYTRDEMQQLIRRLKPAHTLGAFRMTCLITDSADGLTDTDLLCQ